MATRGQEEQSQAALRLVILAPVLVYAAWYVMGRNDLKVVAFLAAYLAVAIGIYVAGRLWPASNASPPNAFLVIGLSWGRKGRHLPTRVSLPHLVQERVARTPIRWSRTTFP
jgi:hypothetical protein